ncbi:Xylanase inhibitor, C-terminal [Dillenia turbinata]|uniref:Xylanase inhibitor, C-terminal n=1 Tax=Dillenia turbinata TaxID=194707 RepID=A0AAN8Z9Z1_9MAGN
MANFDIFGCTGWLSLWMWSIQSWAFWENCRVARVGPGPRIPSFTNCSKVRFGSSSGNSNSLKFTNLGQNANHPSFYYIDIVDISVGGQNLNLPPSLFSSKGSIIDSGTVITRLPKTAYAALRSAFQQQMSNYPTTSPPPQLFDTCYDLSGYGTVNIPKITFLFGNNVNVDIVAEGILVVVSATQYCLAFAGNSDDDHIAIFGNYQQQKYEVVYDVAGGRLGFGPGACD